MYWLQVGEATETALIVLAEKLNPFNVPKYGLDRRASAIIVRQDIEMKWKKEFTLEFSRDRKSMSSYCTPLKPSKLGNGPKLFVKGAPEGVLERCTHARIGQQKVSWCLRQTWGRIECLFVCQAGWLAE